MAIAQGRCPTECRQQIVERVRAGEAPTTLARERKCSASARRNWVNQANRAEGRRDNGPTNAERKELRRLRREIRELGEEHELAAKAAIRFAREAGWVSGILSGSRNERDS